jgi:hypothetical protein
LSANATTATLPLAFEARGASYVWRGSGYTLTIGADGARMDWDRQSLRMRLAAANPEARPQGEDRLPGRVTYLLGSAKGQTYDMYHAVRVPSVYGGIDLLYHGNRQHLEYDFEIAPHAFASSIALAFEGGDGFFKERCFFNRARAPATIPPREASGN